MIAGLLTPVRELWGWVTERWARIKRFFKEKSRKAAAARWAIAILLFFVALGVLVSLSWLLRGAGLWGDLAFAIVVTTGVFWTLRRLAHRFLDEGDIRALPRAFATTIFVLVGIPVAWETRWWGVVLFLIPVGVWALFQLVYWFRQRFYNKKPWCHPVFWEAEVSSVGLVLVPLVVVALWPGLKPSDPVPKAVPAESIEGGKRADEVAKRFQPLLFFDSGERRYPLDVQDAIAARRVEMCWKAFHDDPCEVVESAGEIDENRDYLTLVEAPGTLRGGDENSAVYYHVTGPDTDDERVYVDYWWFYSRNPSPVADKVFCGPGLRLPPYTCQEHAGDWEGLTVVLAPCEAGAPDCEDVDGELLGPEEIRYGQHEHVAAYDWDETLAPLWSSLAAPDEEVLAETWTTVVLPAVAEAGVRPIAFVARNSHASYPDPCFLKTGCSQQTRELPEARHDGLVPWVHNAPGCDGCVKPLPLDDDGDPALWNAFPGRWGGQNCILAGAYCDLSGAPAGPSFQTRYEHPDGEVVQICLGRTQSGAPRLARC